MRADDSEVDAGGLDDGRVGTVARVVCAQQRARKALVHVEPVADRWRVEAEHVGEREALARGTTALPVDDRDRERAVAQRAQVHLEHAVDAIVLLFAALLRTFIEHRAHLTTILYDYVDIAYSILAQYVKDIIC